MKNNLLLFASTLTFLLFTSYSCISFAGIKGSDSIVKSSFDISDFNGIDVSHAISVQIVQADEYKVNVNHNDNLKEFLVIGKSGSVLKIGLKSGKSYKNLKISAIIYTPNIETVKISGAAQVFSSSLTTDNLKVSASGASNFKAEVKCKNLRLQGSGASSFKLIGATENMACELSGASNLKGKALTVQTQLKVQASGASYISILCNGKITPKLSGASSMHYYSSGTIIDESVTGASSVTSK